MTVKSVRASALYLVIVIALAISIFCSALIAVAYYYRAAYKKADRYAILQTNLGSAINILVAGQDTSYAEKTFSLFDGNQDSVKIKRVFWGGYDIGVAQAFINGDTLYKAFSMAHEVDSSKWCAIYLADNGRPLGLSGKTAILGDVFIPPAGVNQAYVNNQAYAGAPNLISGKKHDSQKELPALNEACLDRIVSMFKSDSVLSSAPLPKEDSLNLSFREKTMIVNFKNEPATISGLRLSGNIVLVSDTTITIDSTVKLNHVMVFAKSVIVKDGFSGKCQLFATDSISIGKHCRFGYPSGLGLCRIGKSQVIQSQSKINIADYSTFNGYIFTYQEHKADAEAVINIGRNVLIKGEVYTKGSLRFYDHAEIDGALFVGKLVYQSSFTLYENYLVNITLDENALSSYFLSSSLFPVADSKKKVLEWIGAN